MDWLRAERMKGDKFFYLSLAVVGLFLVALWFLWIGSAGNLLEDVNAATSTQITVTATVGTQLSCSSNVTTTDFGAIPVSLISTSSPNASTTMSCLNSTQGCTLSVSDTGSTGSSTPHGGLYNSTSTHLIPSPSSTFVASTTLLSGSEGYGIQATTTSAGSGASLSVSPRYEQDLLGVNGVGGLSTTTLTLASSTGDFTSREIAVTHKVAISTITIAGTYNDTITYSCTAN